MGNGETEGSWSSNDFTVRVILRAMTRAHELVFSLVPWNNASQMGTDCIDSKVFDTIRGGNKVCGITFKPLNKRSVIVSMILFPRCELNDITIPI